MVDGRKYYLNNPILIQKWEIHHEDLDTKELIASVSTIKS